VKHASYLPTEMSPVSRAAIENLQVLRVAVFHVGLHHEARTVGKASVSIDLVLSSGLTGTTTE
jgi:hypothetical protein